MNQNAVGILTKWSMEGVQRRTLAYLQAAYLYGVESYVYEIDEITKYVQNGYIHAKKWENGQVTDCITDLPAVTEMCTTYKQNTHIEEQNWLFSHTTVLDFPYFGKHELQNRMLADPEVADYAIFTFELQDYYTLLQMLSIVPDAVLKPDTGSKGLGIMTVTKEDDRFVYALHGESGELTEAVFDRYFAAMKENKANCLLFEPRLNILSKDGRATDFRCLVSLNGQNEWENVITYARIGGSGVASNFSDGGSLAIAENVLEEFVPGHAKERLEEMNTVARKVAAFVQKQSELAVSCLGIDICYDQNTDKFFVIEANSKPATGLVGEWQLAKMRAQYFRYVLANR